jgi:uncharacterized protein YndB with AHSA1/START domain
MGGEFVEIDPPKRLVFLSKAFRNDDGSWKIVNHNTVTFEDLGGKTKLTLHTLVQHASDGADFQIPEENMKQGWSGSLDRLAALITAQ